MSLKTLAKIKEALENRPLELAKARENGAKVAGYFCCNIPEEILLALDLIPIRLGTGGNDDLVELGARYISTQNCVFVRQAAGLFAEGKDPYVINSDVILIAGTCLQIYRLGEAAEHYFGADVKVLGVPRNFTLPEGQEYFRREMRQFGTDLEEYAGKKLTAEKLNRSIRLLAEIRDSINRLYALQTNNGAISWRQVFETVHAGFYLDRELYLTLLKELIAEAEAAGADILSKNVTNVSRIFISGSIIPRGDTKIIDLIEQVGGVIVGDDLCSGLRPFRGLYVHKATVDSIADAYLLRVPCAALPNLKIEGDRRVINLLDSIRDSRADGLVYHTLRYCDPFTFKANETKRLLAADIPFIEIHTEYSESDIEPIRTRLQAFIEVLNGRKRKRPDETDRDGIERRAV
jgi:benzoyl-CoA reductase/2-hydroxyglutaryl-CoA dehydratase subunit BcrC/BadD/HgdB